MKKILCLFLATIMLFSVCSCADGGEDDSPETTVAETNGTDAATEAETEGEKLEVPDKYYDGVDITFLTRDENEWSTIEIYAESLDATGESTNAVINDAVFERNQLVNETYGVNIRELKTKDLGSSVSKEVQGKNGDFYAISHSVADLYNTALSGYLYDLHSDANQYMDFTKSWWDHNAAQGLSINEQLYYATGDLLVLDNDATFILMFSKELHDQYGFKSIYDMVENNEWTFDEMYTMVSQISDDKNSDGLDYDVDTYGFLHTDFSPTPFLYAGGMITSPKDDKDLPDINLDIELTQNIIDSAKRIFEEKTHTIDMVADVQGDLTAVGVDGFGGGHSLFMSEVMQCVTRLRGADETFGVVPYPKYSTSQSNYCHVMHSTGTFISIPVSLTGDNLDMTTHIIEAMAYHSQDTLTTAYYDITLISKGTRDPESGPMIDLILNTRVFDLSMYYDWGGLVGNLSNIIRGTESRNVSSIYKAAKRSTKTAMTKTIEAFEKNAENAQ